MVPINWHFTAEEAGSIIRDCGAGVIVIHADLLPQIAEGIPADESVLVVPTPPETRAAYEISPHRCSVPEDSIEWNGWLDGYTPWDNPSRPPRTNITYTWGRPVDQRAFDSSHHCKRRSKCWRTWWSHLRLSPGYWAARGSHWSGVPRNSEPLCPVRSARWWSRRLATTVPTRRICCGLSSNTRFPTCIWSQPCLPDFCGRRTR